MPILKPVLGQPRPSVITPQEAQQMFTPEVVNFGTAVEGFDPDEFSRINLDLAIQGGVQGLEEARAMSQTTGGLFLKGLGNIIGTAAFEFAKTPGYIGGAVNALADQDFSRMVDNQYLDAINWMQEQTQGRLAEVYTPPSLSEAGLLKQLSNPYFWASEGANGVGFLLSFMLPGQLIKAAGLGSKVTSGLSKAGRLGELVVDGQKVLQSADGPNMLGRLLLKGIGKTGRAMDFERAARNIDSGAAIITNTLLEASAEAADTYDQLVEQGRSTDEAANAASRVFGWNMGLLAASNTILEKYLMSGFNRLAEAPPLSRVTSKVITGKDQLKRAGVGAMLGRIATKAPIAVAQEGLFEEGLQTTVQQAEGAGFSEVMEQYMHNLDNMFGDDQEAIEFGKAVVLGGVLGGGVGAVSAVSDVNAENRYLFGSSRFTPTSVQKFFNYKAREATEGALPMLRNAHKALKEDSTALFEYDQDGKVKGFSSGAKDKIKDAGAINMLTNYYNDLLTRNGGDTRQTATEFTAAIQKMAGNSGAARLFYQMVKAPDGISNEEALRFVQRRQDMDYFAKFLSLPQGEELLKAHMEDMLTTVQERYELNTGLKMGEGRVKQIRDEMQSNMDKAKQAYDTVNRDHSLSRYRIDPAKDQDDPDAAREEFLDFFGRTKQARIETLQLLKYYESRAQELRPKTEDETLTEDERKAYKGDLTAYEEAIKAMQERYTEMSTSTGLGKLWKEFYDKKKVVDTELKQESQPSTPASSVAVTKEDFWKTITDAGYAVSKDDKGNYRFDDTEPIHLISKGKRYVMDAVKGQGGAKIRLRDFKDPSKSKIYNNFREVLKDFRKAGLQVVPKAEAQKLRATMQQQQALRKVELERKALRSALDSKVNEVERLLKAGEKEIAAIDKQIEELHKQLTSNLESAVEAKDLQKSVRKAIRDLRKQQAILQQMRTELQDQLQLLKAYQELVKANEPLKASLEQLEEDLKLEIQEQKYDTALLDELDAINNRLMAVNQLIVDIDDQIVDLSQLEVVLDLVIKAHERNARYYAAEDTAAFTDKYSYTNAQGRKVSLPKFEIALDTKTGKARIKNIGRIERHLARLAELNKRPVDEVMDEFDRDLLGLQLGEQAQTGRINPDEQLLATREQIKLLNEQREKLVQETRLLSMAKNLKLHDQLSREMNDRFKKEFRRMAKSSDSQQVPPDDGELSYDPDQSDPFYRHALSAMIFESTGLNIEYNREGNDLRKVTGGALVPVASPSLYQQQFFRWLDRANLGDFKAVAVTAYYDQRHGDMLQHFLNNNETDRRPGEDVFVLIQDKDGNQVMGEKNLPLFTSLRRVESKFPMDQAPKMSMQALINYYAQEVFGYTKPVTQAEMKETKKLSGHQKLVQGLAQATNQDAMELYKLSSKEFFDMVAQEATKWGRARYASIIEKIKTSPGGRMELPITGITSGHPVKFLNKDGKAQTFDPIEVFGLEFHANGAPKNFSLLKADHSGMIMIGGKKVRGFFPGMLYIKVPSGQVVPLKADTLNDEEVRLIIHTLADIANKGSLNITMGTKDTEFTTLAEWSSEKNKYIYVGQNKKSYGLSEGQHPLRVFPAPKERFSLMTMIMNWGWTRKDRVGQYDIWIDNGKVNFGTASVPLATVKASYEAGDLTAIQPLLDFLKQKHFHVNFQMLDTQTTRLRPYLHPKLKGGKIVFEDVSEGFFKFIMSRMKTEAVPQKQLDKHNLPQFAQRNLQFADPLMVFKPSDAKKESNKSSAQRQGTAPSPPVEQTAPGDGNEAMRMLQNRKAFNQNIATYPVVKKLFDSRAKVAASIETSALTAQDVAVMEQDFLAVTGWSKEQLEAQIEEKSKSRMTKMMAQGKPDQALYLRGLAISSMVTGVITEYKPGQAQALQETPSTPAATPKAQATTRTRQLGRTRRGKAKPESTPVELPQEPTDEVEGLTVAGVGEAEQEEEPKTGPTAIDLSKLMGSQAGPVITPTPVDDDTLFEDKRLSSSEQLNMLIQQGIIKRDNCT